MSSRVFRLILPVVFLISLSYLGYRGFLWWQKEQKQRELFVYLQKKSPVTRRIPADAFVYINLYDLQRLYGDWKGTGFSEVMAHWMDTGLSGKEKANPLLGGMLEKTILNVLGNEFGLAILPGKSGTPEILGIARVSPGSDFLLNILLSSAKNVEKTDLNDHLVYAFALKKSVYPKIYVVLDDPLAFVSTSIDRLQQSLSGEGTGPDFLNEKRTRAIPEDTFFFLEAPAASAIAFGQNHRYQLIFNSDETVEAGTPTLRKGSVDILSLQTNVTALFGHPAASYSLQNAGNTPVSGLFLQFDNQNGAKDFVQNILSHNQAEDGSPKFEHFSHNGMPCYKFKDDGVQSMCRKGAHVLLAQDGFDLGSAEFVAQKKKSAQSLLLNLDFQPKSISGYAELVRKKDWSRFQDAKAFYFLSCVRQLSGEINGTSDQINLEIQ